MMSIRTYVTDITNNKPLDYRDGLALFADEVAEPHVLDLGTVHGDYAEAFWRPYLGGAQYSLYRTFLLLGRMRRRGLPRASVDTVAALCGYGDRYSLLGREACAGRPRQTGLVDDLAHEGLVAHHYRGSGRQRRHFFLVLPLLPVLTPAQAAAAFTPKIQDLHELYLGSVRGFDLPGWRRIEALSFVPLVATQQGMIQV